MTTATQVGIVAFYTYLTVGLGPQVVGYRIPGMLAGAAVSYGLYETMGKKYFYL